MWSISYVISQMLVLFAGIFLGASYAVKNKKVILVLSVVFSILYAISYVLLGAYTAFYINLFCVVRSILIYVDDVKGRHSGKIELTIFIVVHILLMILTFDGFPAVISTVGGIIYTYSLWQKSIKVYRWLSIICSLCWLVYNSIIVSIFAIAVEVALLIVKIVSVCNIKKENIV